MGKNSLTKNGKEEKRVSRAVLFDRLSICQFLVKLDRLFLPELFKHFFALSVPTSSEHKFDIKLKGTKGTCVGNTLMMGSKHAQRPPTLLRNLALAGQRLQAVLHVLGRKWANKTASWPSVRYIIRG